MQWAGGGRDVSGSKLATSVLAKTRGRRSNHAAYAAPKRANATRTSRSPKVCRCPKRKREKKKRKREGKKNLVRDNKVNQLRESSVHLRGNKHVAAALAHK
jgi:hypothetical protein